MVRDAENSKIKKKQLEKELKQRMILKDIVWVLEIPWIMNNLRI
jgi:hypothetical protein